MLPSRQEARQPPRQRGRRCHAKAATASRTRGTRTKASLAALKAPSYAALSVLLLLLVLACFGGGGSYHPPSAPLPWLAEAWVPAAPVPRPRPARAPPSFEAFRRPCPRPPLLTPRAAPAVAVAAADREAGAVAAGPAPSLSEAAPLASPSSAEAIDSEGIPRVLDDLPASPPRPGPPVDPKELAKLFGRLAERYLLMDASGGSCCYSGCTGCEFRLPGGGYRMADSRSARPKWIPSYGSRARADGTLVRSAWSRCLFGEGDDDEAASAAESENEAGAKSSLVDRDEFFRRIRALPYEAPLGGPSLSASAAEQIDDGRAVEALWQFLTRNGKSAGLTRAAMQRQWQRMAAGAGSGGGGGVVGGASSSSTGVTWKHFSAALLQESGPLPPQ